MPDYATSHHLNGYPTPTGRFQFKPDWAKFGPDHARMPKLPDHFAIIDEADDERPFRLVAARAQLPEHQLHRDADLDPQGGAADRAGPSPRTRGGSA